jgi:hypothetical protein
MTETSLKNVIKVKDPNHLGTLISLIPGKNYDEKFSFLSGLLEFTYTESVIDNNIMTQASKYVFYLIDNTGTINKDYLAYTDGCEGEYFTQLQTDVLTEVSNEGYNIWYDFINQNISDDAIVYSITAG